MPMTGIMAADPAQIDTVEYAYLEGEEGVMIESRMGFEIDGVEIGPGWTSRPRRLTGEGWVQRRRLVL